MHTPALLHFTIVVFAIALLLVSGCAQKAILFEGDASESTVWPEETEVHYRIFLLGNIGATGAATSQRMLSHHLERSAADHAIVFLGNNVPCCMSRHETEKYLSSWLDMGKQHNSRFLFIPGHVEDGAAADMRRTEWDFQAFLETYTGQENILLPADGHPGPQAIKLADGVRLLALDTQYWMNGYTLSREALDHDIREPADVLRELEDQLFRYRNDRLIVVGHHPFYSNGNYGGRFSLKQYVFPVPLVSGLVTAYRSLVGRSQDFSSGPYRLFREEVLRVFSSQHKLIYAAAHDHSLQYFLKDNRRRVQHHIVSGSAVKGDYVSKGRGVNFATAEEGFMVLDLFEDGSAWLSAWGADEEQQGGRLMFRQRLYSGETLADTEGRVVASVEVKKAAADSAVQAINPNYARVSGVGEVLFGRQYRDLWATPVSVPALDITSKRGGLEVLKVGGQSQSVTMRFKGGDGDYYMLRSIDKVATRSLSPAMRRTFARSIVQDQVAMMHPYGAFLIPSLAEAAGVYHTNPELVYIAPGSPISSVSPFFSGQLALFEERPDEDMSDKKSFGYSSNIIGSAKLMSELEGDNDHYVDAASFARARLFDMLIADHDRTFDNFRWASFEPYELDDTLEGEARTQGKVYKPVPRDRDKAFARVDGVLPGLYRGLSEPAWQPFAENYGYIRGLNRKGMPLDRRFTAVLQKSDWIRIAEEIEVGLSDAVIEQAVFSWPDPVREKAGEEMLNTLKARRDKLPQVAGRYYDVLAAVIDVVGSNKHELFEVTRIDDDKTEVVVYKVTKEGERRQEVFRRMVHHAETKEIRLYGFAGDDRFMISGEVDKSIRVIAVGGGGEDRFVDESVVRKGPRKTHIYDIPEDTHLEAGEETKATLKLSPVINAYNFDGFKPDLIRPVGYFGANRDDGIFVGTGFKWSRHGFRKVPHKATHQLMGNYAARTGAFNVRYLGNYASVLGKWDMDLEVGVYNPNNIRNFYGLGNETDDSEGSRRFYQARFSRIVLHSSFSRSFDSGVRLFIGPALKLTDVRNEEDRFIRQPQAGVSLGSFDHLFFGSIAAGLNVDAVDNANSPFQGFRFSAGVDLNQGLRETSDSFARLSAEWTLYMSPSLSPQVTLAFRAGGAHNVGDFPFFESNTLGGSHNLRGYRNTRYAGRSSLYQNAELRVQVAEFSGYLGFGRVGIFGFMDNGRVWTDGERSRVWHQGYGGGVWLNYFEQFLVSTEAGFSDEDQTFTVRLGFLY